MVRHGTAHVPDSPHKNNRRLLDHVHTDPYLGVSFCFCFLVCAGDNQAELGIRVLDGLGTDAQ